MKKLILSSAAALAILLGVNTVSQAATIPGLQNTGVGATGTSDPAWQLTLDASGGSVPRAATIISPLTGTSPFNWYSGSPIGAGANWIGPDTGSNHNPGDADGTYEYQLQFNLSGYDPSTASFVYESAADNLVLSGTLNGNSIPIDTRAPGGGNQYHTLSGPLTVNSGFVAGVNTLTFDVSNTTPDPSPTGFLFLVDSSVVSVPEPSTVALVGVGLAGLLAFRRRK